MKRILTALVLTLAMLAPASARSHRSYTYRNSDHVRVHRPTKTPHTGGTYQHGYTAVCRDGSYSYSQHRSGTCSHHGGVRR